MTELKFNLGKSRSEFIGSLVNAITNQFISASIRKREKDVIGYYTFLEALHLELQTWVNESQKEELDEELEEDLVSDLDERFKEVGETIEEQGWMPDQKTSLHGVEEYEEVMNDLKNIQKALSKIRTAVGLDIPATKSIDPEDAGVSGLRD